MSWSLAELGQSQRRDRDDVGRVAYQTSPKAPRPAELWSRVSRMYGCCGVQFMDVRAGEEYGQ